MWTVVYAACSGLETHRQTKRRLFTDLSCEITVVRETGCAGSGPADALLFTRFYCVAAYESTALVRTLHVIDRVRYALYRS